MWLRLVLLIRVPKPSSSVTLKDGHIDNHCFSGYGAKGEPAAFDIRAEKSSTVMFCPTYSFLQP
jgi:hypothetical protein